MSNPSQSALAPLANVRVLELGQIAAGPFTASLLADLGADVVKIERPDGGDGMRGALDDLVGGTGDGFATWKQESAEQLARLGLSFGGLSLWLFAVCYSARI